MKSISKKLVIRILIIGISLAAVSYLIFNENGVLKFLKMKSEMRDLNKEILNAEERLKTLEAEIDSLKKSKAKIERVAREKYNMMFKKEKVFKIEEN